MARKPKVKQGDTDIDMTPMIDIIFLLIIFFILAGRITSELRTNWITVPPTKTAEEIKPPPDWGHMVIEVSGSTTNARAGAMSNTIIFGNQRWQTNELNDFTAYIGLRQALNGVYDRAIKYDDPLGTGMKLPQVELEIRADGDAQYRLVQEVLQVASDSVDPANEMKPKDHAASGGLAAAKPFVNIQFTTFKPGDRESN
jgi:biopolymer transport protein ExbD